MIRTARQLWQNPYLRGVVYLGLLYLAYLFFRETQAIWISFLIAYTLAYLIHPLVTSLEERGVARWLGVALTMLALLFVLASLVYIGSQVVRELSTFGDEIPALFSFLQDLPQRLERTLPPGLAGLLGTTIDDFSGQLMNVQGAFVSWLEANGAELLRSALGIVGGALQIAVILILTAYLLYKFVPFSTSFLEVFPERHQPFARELAAKLDSVVGGYLRAQVLIAIGVGVSVWLGLVLLDIPLAAALGTLAGFANVVPLLGPIIAGVPALLLALTKGWLYALGVLVLLVVINQIDGNLVSPVVFARTTRIQPITVIIAVTVGLSLFGLWGALVAVPFAAFVKLLYYDYYQSSRWYRKS